MTPAHIPSFSFLTAADLRFGRGAAEAAIPDLAALGSRLLLVHSRSAVWSERLEAALQDAGCWVIPMIAKGEPDLATVTEGRELARAENVDAVIALGGGSAIDLGKAIAALVPAEGDILTYLEGVGDGRALPLPPLPFAALPTTAGTGAEVTKNAVIAVPEAGRKVSLRDPRMLPRLAVVDPALTDNAPKAVTLASGLDAVTQVVEPYLSSRANPLTDALCEKAIPLGLHALQKLAQEECPRARDDLAFVSLCGGLALANAGLGAVHGLAGVIGGRTGAPHGLICGRLLGPVMATNRQALSASDGPVDRFERVIDWLSEVFQTPADTVLGDWPETLTGMGVPSLRPWLEGADLEAIAREAAGASSMKANPVVLSQGELCRIMEMA